jgi:hypothetical protein
MNQLKEDVNESNLNDNELDDLDFDVKEATKLIENESGWVDLTVGCNSYKTATDVTCCKLRK